MARIFSHTLDTAGRARRGPEKVHMAVGELTPRSGISFSQGCASLRFRDGEREYTVRLNEGETDQLIRDCHRRVKNGVIT